MIVLPLLPEFPSSDIEAVSYTMQHSTLDSLFGQERSGHHYVSVYGLRTHAEYVTELIYVHSKLK